MCVPVAVADDLQIIETKHQDQLDDVNQAAGSGDVSMGNGEGVSLFNGNLLVTHANSPTYPHDGRLSISLSRSYNSHRVRKDKVVLSHQEFPEGFEYGYYVSGRSWVGLGWTSHMGRISGKAIWKGGPPLHYGEMRSSLEFPTGSLYRFEPTVTRAHPNIKVKWFPSCAAPPPPPDASYCERYPDSPHCEFNPDASCEIRPPDDPEHYRVTFPDGTRYRLEEMVPEDELALGWIKNYDREGFYTTKIEDVYGNAIEVEYWGAGYPFPEAIKTVKRVDSSHNAETLITTTLCVQNDPNPERCPAEAVGMLKELRGVAFQGSRQTAQETIYQFSYGTVSVTDSDGTRNEPVLSRVLVVGSDGSDGGAIEYGYGVGMSLGVPVTTYGPLLDRITYPLGAVSEYRYQPSTSGCYAGQLRTVIGVSRHTMYPEGQDAGGGISGKPHYSWNWTREFRPEVCGPDHGIEKNDYEQSSPDGTKSRFTFFGSPGGQVETPDLGPWGRVKTAAVLEPGTTNPVRTQTLSYDYERNIDNELVKELVVTQETVLADDDGVCFSSGGTATKSLKTTFRDRDSYGRWKMVVQGGDSYMPLSNGEPVQRVTYTHYQGPGEKPCWWDNHIIGPYDYRYVEEGEGQKRRYEENFEFDCRGALTSVRARNEWQTATTDPATGSPVTPNQPADGDDLVQSASYEASTGRLLHIGTSGGDGYPDGAPTNTYGASLTWSHGVQATARVDGLSYDSIARTIDKTGLVSTILDANGLEARFDFDALGRLAKVDPPGDTEYPVRYVYADSKHVRVLRSPGAETAFDPANPDQLYEEQEADGLGRIVQTWRAMPDGTRSTQVLRYDQLGRAIFASGWMTEAELASAPKTTWDSGDLDGDGIVDYSVAGIPLRDGRPWGTVTFYGVPDAAEPGNPLRAIPDALGRVRRVEAADGSAVERSYCGPHVQETVKAIRTGGAIPEYEDAVTRMYHDALGRLVLVDAPEGSADAEYRYDPKGNLERVNLLAQLPADPFEAWRQGTIPRGQIREFKYDAVGRLAKASDPETGARYTGSVDANGNVTATYYDAGGNLLAYQDANGSERGYFFRNFYDFAGRLTRSERVRGTPGAPLTQDLVRFDDGGFESDMGGWQEGTISGEAFVPGDSFWRRMTYGAGSCVSAPPAQSGNTAALYLGDAADCSYAAAPSGPQAVRRFISSADRDDVVSFKFWRQVREGTGPLDSFKVFVARKTLLNPNDVSERRIILQIDQDQASLARWQQGGGMRIGDLFPTWGEGSQEAYLYVVFEKGDTAQSGIGTGVAIDDVFVGQRGIEPLTESLYDADMCSGGEPEAGEACLGGSQSANSYLGRLSRITSYEGGQVTSRKWMAYKGLNGRPSGEKQTVDWAGVGEGDSWVSRVAYDAQGQPVTWIAPYQPGVDDARRYEYRYRRGFLDGVFDFNGPAFLEPGASPPSLAYSPGGAVTAIRLGNGTTATYARPGGRLDTISVTGPAPGGGTQMLWSSGSYMFDGAGNISAIGNQQFTYDMAKRLIYAEVLPQASDPSENVPYRISYAYDIYGNMLSRTWAHEAGETAPLGFEFTHTYSSNQIQGSSYSYDPAGNATRMLGANTGPAAAMWDDRGRMAAFYNGRPEDQAAPAERYGYDASGVRAVRTPMAGDGRPVISIRGGTGRTVSEFGVDSASGHPELRKEYVYAGGQLLVERRVVATFPTFSAADSPSGSGTFRFAVGGSSTGTYAVDVRTAGGFRNLLSGLTPDGNGILEVSEAALSSGQTNWLRVRGESPEAEPYSAPVTVAYDPSVNAESANQVRSVAVRRSGTNVVVRWSLFQSNGKRTKVYFRRTGAPYPMLLTIQGLDSTVRQFVLPDQALASPCGEFTLTQTNPNGSGETGHSVGSGLPGGEPLQELAPANPQCEENPPPPSAPGYRFADSFHHRDHLGSLRVVTDAGGWRVRAHDYYPFGMEILEAGVDPSGGSAMRYTGHERDFDTGTDYMVMRSKLVNAACFMSPDPVGGNLGSPGSFNRYAYVMGNPVDLTDPLGLMAPTDCSLFHADDAHDGDYCGGPGANDLCGGSYCYYFAGRWYAIDYIEVPGGDSANEKEREAAANAVQVMADLEHRPMALLVIEIDPFAIERDLSFREKVLSYVLWAKPTKPSSKMQRCIAQALGVRMDAVASVTVYADSATFRINDGGIPEFPYAISLGSTTIVTKDAPSKFFGVLGYPTLLEEYTHAILQYGGGMMTWGNYIEASINTALQGGDSYDDNPFERMARDISRIALSGFAACMNSK